MKCLWRVLPYRNGLGDAEIGEDGQIAGLPVRSYHAELSSGGTPGKESSIGQLVKLYLVSYKKGP